MTLFCAVSLGVIEAKTGRQIPEQAFWAILGLFGSFAAGNGLEWLGKARAIGQDVAASIPSIWVDPGDDTWDDPTITHTEIDNEEQ